MKSIFITTILINFVSNFSYELNLFDRESECNTFIHNNNNNHMIIQILVVINKRNTNNKYKKIHGHWLLYSKIYNYTIININNIVQYIFNSSIFRKYILNASNILKNLEKLYPQTIYE